MLTVTLQSQAARNGECLGGTSVPGGRRAEAEKPPLFFEIGVDASVAFVAQEVGQEKRWFGSRIDT